MIFWVYVTGLVLVGMKLSFTCVSGVWAKIFFFFFALCIPSIPGLLAAVLTFTALFRLCDFRVMLVISLRKLSSSEGKKDLCDRVSAGG